MPKKTAKERLAALTEKEAKLVISGFRSTMADLGFPDHNPSKEEWAEYLQMKELSQKL